MNIHSLQNLSARHKLPAAVLLSFGIASIQNMYLAVFALLLGSILSCLSGMERKKIFKTLYLVNIFSIFVILTIPWQTSEQAQYGSLFSLGPIAYTTTGLFSAMRIILKSNAIMLVTLALLCTSSLGENAAAMLRFGIPQKLVTLLLLVSRHMQSFADQAKNIQQSAKLRGFTPKTNPRSWKISAYFVTMLLINCFDKAKRTEEAMLLRGFSGTFPLLSDQSPVPKTGGNFLLASSIGLFCLFTGVGLFL